ncbi:MAG: hypothetical protein QM784_37480 [Polyangiaceae bacterium]
MGKAPELVRIRRKPIALVRTSPKELWVIVNEEEIEGSFSYLQRSIIYWIHENETALVFEEAQVGHYVERWAPIPNGIVVQERLLAAPGEALRISMITKHGSRTLLKESFRAPVVFGTVRNQVVLALWTDGDKVRITNWDAQGRKFERIFEETSCGPDLFLAERGISPPHASSSRCEAQVLGKGLQRRKIRWAREKTPLLPTRRIRCTESSQACRESKIPTGSLLVARIRNGS